VGGARGVDARRGGTVTLRVDLDRGLAAATLAAAVTAAWYVSALAPRLGPGGDWTLDGPGLLFALAFLAAIVWASLLALVTPAGAGAGRGLAAAALAGAAWGAAACTLDLAGAAILWSAGWILAAAAVAQGGGHERMEAAVKTQGLGAAAGLVLLLAAALLVGLAGTTHLLEAGALITSRVDSQVLALSSVRVLLAGLGLAAAWVPFHYWAPDGLGSATRPAGLVLAVAAPLSASLALARVLFAFEPALDALAVSWKGGLFAISLLTVAVAGSVALVQKDAARLTAYLTVVQAAELLPALAPRSGDAGPWAAAAVAHVLALAPAWLALGAWSAAGRPTSFAAMAGRGREHRLAATLWLAALALAAGFPGGPRFALRPVLAWTTGEPAGWTLLFLLSALLQWAAAARLARVLFLEIAPADEPPPARPAGRAWIAWSLAALALAVELWLGSGHRPDTGAWRMLLPGA